MNSKRYLTPWRIKTISLKKIYSSSCCSIKALTNDFQECSESFLPIWPIYPKNASLFKVMALIDFRDVFFEHQIYLNSMNYEDFAYVKTQLDFWKDWRGFQWRNYLWRIFLSNLFDILFMDFPFLNGGNYFSYWTKSTVFNLEPKMKKNSCWKVSDANFKKKIINRGWSPQWSFIIYLHNNEYSQWFIFFRKLAILSRSFWAWRRS